MATRARIAIENEDGTYTSAYQHWDGYPGGLGYKLVNHWDNPALVRKAIELGDASSWGTHIGTKVDFDARDTHGSQNIYYTRDRGEYCPCNRSETLDELLTAESWEEYIYVMKQDGEWYYHAVQGQQRELGDVHQLLPLATRAIADHVDILKNHLKMLKSREAA
jgi:hypothetical protein